MGRLLHSMQWLAGLSLFIAYLHLLLIGCHSQACFFCLRRQISGWSVKPGTWLKKLDPEPLNVKGCDVLLASVASCSRVCLVCVSTAALVWLWEGTETCCDLIAGLLTPFHWRLCLFSRHPKLFPPVVLSHIACCLLYTHRIWVSGGEDSCFDCVKLCDKFSFAPVWMWRTGFVTVSKIPLVHWEQEQLSCHSGYTLTLFRTSCLWDLCVGNFEEGECSEVQSSNLSLWDKTQVLELK